MKCNSIRSFVAGGLLAGLSLLPSLDVRAQSAGSIDTTFTAAPGAEWIIYSMARQPDGKIVIGGQFVEYNNVSRKRVARLNADGSLDTSFNPGGAADGYVYAVALQTDGKVIVAGNFGDFNGSTRRKIARLNSDGSVDASFDPGESVNASIFTVAVQADGKILAGGSFTTSHGQSRNYVTRFNGDGTLDTAFAPGTGFNNSVLSISLQADGKSVAGGYFSSFNGTARANLARLNADGTLDATLNAGIGPNGYVESVAIAPDNKIYAGGGFYSFAGNIRVLRLNADGTPDNTFNANLFINADVRVVLPQTNGGSLIGGQFTTVGGVSRNHIARLNADGSLDTGFDPGTGANNIVYSIIFDGTEEKIVAGGFFTEYAGQPRGRITKIHNNSPQPPVITSHPQDQTLTVGGTISLSVTVTVNVGPCTFQWRKGGVDIPGATGSTLVITPAALTDSGSYDVVVTCPGGSATSNAATVSVLPNAAPTIDTGSLTNRTILEDAGTQVVNLTGVTSGAAHETNQVITITVSSSNTGIIPVPAVTYTNPATTGSFSFAPATNANGVVTITIVVSDDGGTASGGVAATTNSFTVTVTPVNDAPSFTKGADQFALQNAGAQTVTGWATSISPGPADESGQTVSFNVSNTNNAIFAVQPAISPTGVLTFTPQPGASGTALVTVTLQDNGGTTDGGVDTSAAQTFLITIGSTAIYVADTAAVGAGDTIVVPVRMVAAGTENAAGFTIEFDTNVLTFSSLAAGSDTPSLSFNTNVAVSGKIGLLASKAAGALYAAGTNNLAEITFTVSASAPAGTTPVTFSDSPTIKQVTDATATPLEFILYVPNVVTILNAVATQEADVAPRSIGNGVLSASDVVQVARFVTGLDTAAPGAGGEFQRADCAPKATLGDGKLTTADWVQATRYVVGLDAPVALDGPTVQTASLAPAALLASGTGRRLWPAAGAGLTPGGEGAVSIRMLAQGGESAVGLSASFDAGALEFVRLEAGADMGGGMAMANDIKAGAGRVGLLVALPAGASLSAGEREVARLIFRVEVATPGATLVDLAGDNPMVREVADATATVLPALFESASVPIQLPAGFKALGVVSLPDGSKQLAFGNANGSPVTAAQLAGLEVFATSDITAATWTRLENALAVVNGMALISDAQAGSGARFYRVQPASTTDAADTR